MFVVNPFQDVVWSLLDPKQFVKQFVKDLSGIFAFVARFAPLVFAFWSKFEASFFQLQPSWLPCWGLLLDKKLSQLEGVT